MVRGDRIGARRFAVPETAVVALLAVTAYRTAAPVVALATGSQRLPQWDMAKYGVSGLRLARALQDVDLLTFLRHLNGLDVWPPVFPLLEVPAFLLAGPGYSSARGLVAALSATDTDRLLQGHGRHTVDASTIEVLDAITNRAAAVQSTVLLGTWNHLSPCLVEWSCLQQGSSMDPDQVPREPTGRPQRGNIVGWLAAESPAMLMVVSASPRSKPRAGFVAETSWLEPLRKRLVRDARFDLVSRGDFPTTFYRLESFIPARTGAQPVPR